MCAAELTSPDPLLGGARLFCRLLEGGRRRYSEFALNAQKSREVSAGRKWKRLCGDRLAALLDPANRQA